MTSWSAGREGKPSQGRRWPRRDVFARLLAISGLAVGMLSLAQPAYAGTFSVSNAVELQQAIDDAVQAGGPSMINLAAGTYHFDTTANGYLDVEAGNASDTDITLVGSGASSTVLDGDGGNSFNQPLIVKDGLAPVTIEDVTIENSGTGGSITAFRGLTVRDSVVSGNAGGIQDLGGLDLSGTTVSGDAGGVYVEAPFSAENTTISGNQGAGLDIDGSESTETLLNVTIAANTGTGLLGGDQVVVTNTIIAGNQSDCANLSAEASSGGHNLAGDSTCRRAVHRGRGRNRRPPARPAAGQRRADTDDGAGAGQPGGRRRRRCCMPAHRPARG